MSKKMYESIRTLVLFSIGFIIGYFIGKIYVGV
jgi:hypothetical protein